MSQDFESLGVCPEILAALQARGYETPTPIQAGSIPHLLDGADLLGIAQTGTGKTAAFSIPMLQILDEEDQRPRPGRPRALVLAPTRELALQIKDACVSYGSELGLVTALVFGGVGQMPQVKALQKGVDILIATPGRLLDLMSQGHCKLTDVDILVLDEADRMLDMGFLPDVRRILQKCPKERQSLLFSATMPEDITALANKFLFEPVRVEVTPPAATADRVEQSVYHVQKAKKRELLVKLLEDPAFVRTLVFTRTKHGADRVAKHLLRAGIPAHAIHGNKSQGARERAPRDHPRRQLRPAQRGGELRAPHRPHRARRPRRHRDLVLRRGRARLPARHPEADQAAHPVAAAAGPRQGRAEGCGQGRRPAPP